MIGRRPWRLVLFGLALAGVSGYGSRALDWRETPGYRWAPLEVPPEGQTGFSRMDPGKTGIGFTNSLSESSALINQIYLNGSGVTAGDVNGSGRVDLYFCRLEGPNALYINQGGWRFERADSSGGIACEGQFSTGAVLTDIDGDGRLDLLVSSVANGVRSFINNGEGALTEVTADSGLADEKGSMSLALADVDQDGDLDLYVTNYRATTFRDRPDMQVEVTVDAGQPVVDAVDDGNSPEAQRFKISFDGELLENGLPDRLYLNDGAGRFRSVTWTAGRFLDENGVPLETAPRDWGLSARFADLNGDGAPDLYVCNDFHSPDRIWINNGEGIFQALPHEAIRQTPLYSMGVDIADINRDDSPDLLVLDMLSPEHRRRMIQVGQRTQYRPDANGNGDSEMRPQSMRNMLFLNRGDGTFAEIGQYSRVAASGWSWTPLFLDVDLDGFEDLLITTGHARDVLDADVRKTIEHLKRSREWSPREQLLLRRRYRSLEIPNRAYRNLGTLEFEETSRRWGFDSRQISHGMIAADLDRDGDRDVVVNSLNGPALLYRNHSSAPRVAVGLWGPPGNAYGIGARIELTGGPCHQSAQISRGGPYLSSGPARAVFAATAADPETPMQLRVIWPDGHGQSIRSIQADRRYEVKHPKARKD